MVGRYTGLTVGSSGNPSSDYTASYGFDAYGRLDSVSDGSNTFTYGYLADSNLIQTMTSPVHTTTYTYEDERDLRRVVDNATSGGSLSKYTYQHDKLGRRSTRVQEGTAFAQATVDIFGYNTRSEVIDSTRFEGVDPGNPGAQITPKAFSYEYDPIGNRLSSQIGTNPQRDYTTTALNQYSEIHHPSLILHPSFDADGNLTDSGTGWHYKWDAENRLIKAQNYQFTPDTGSKRLYFIYDYQSRRVAKTVEEWNGATWVETSDHRYLYDGWNLIAKYEFQSSQFTLHSSFLWGLDLSQSIHGAGGVGGLLNVTEHAGTHQGTYVYTYDANGNVGQVLNSTGATVAQYEYDPFGNIINQTGTYADANTFRFSTKYFDVETGLYYYGYRYLDPETGRWLNRDPIEEQGGVNLYVFVGNNAIWFIDPDGRFVWNAVSAAAGAIAGAVSGAISGAASGSGASAVAGAVVGGIVGAATGAAVGALGNPVAGAAAGQLAGSYAGSIAGGAVGGFTGSVAGQVASGMAQGQSFGQAVGSVDYSAATAAAIGGGAAGALGTAAVITHGAAASVQLSLALPQGIIIAAMELFGGAFGC